MRKTNLRTQIILTIAFILLSVAIIFPFVLVLSISFSNEGDIINNGYKIIPENFDLSAYKFIFRNPGTVLQAYKVTAIFSLSSMVLSVVFMSLIAYPLSQKQFIGRKVINFIVYFTMLFGGGLVPAYILNTQYLHLGNTIWIYIIPGLINPWYVFMMRTFFSQIPDAIHESAVIDGANEFYFLFRIMYPLSKPVLAAIALFTLLGSWNNWFTSMLYIDDPKLVSLQYMLQKIMNNIKMLQESVQEGGASSIQMSASEIPTETVRMAMAVVVAGPALLVFPFFQKYFVKGLTVGSVKG